MKFSADNLKNGLDKDRIGDWIVKYKRQVAVGCAAFCLVVFAGASLAGAGASKEGAGASPAAAGTAQGTEEGQQGALISAAGAAEAAATENANTLEKDAYPAVNELMQNYYHYMAVGDMEGLASVEDTTSEEEQNRILRSIGLVEEYRNISCYTKRGMEEGSYVVYVTYELKFSEIETAAPGLKGYYVYTNDEGNLVIFNGEDASDELNDYVDAVSQDEDVLALQEEVRARYEEAKAADADLAEQEARYQKIAAGGSGEETAEEEPAEEVPAEETTEEPAQEEPAEEPAEEEPAEEPAEEEPAEEPAEEAPAEGSATAQNRETRFTESVRLRSEPSTEAEYLGTAYQGEHVTQIESYEDGWSKINYNGTECYCMTQYLE